ncbi:ABC transporter substrate-binding protein [Chromatocurvus halotolerans]|uniref:ABC transporter substrate-binding protein n=1 Tax=Chromatocurvus halotolerans TaxID=1132028 RepID=UPI0013C31E48|nr:ABC transporter substrate-binding protein [Chromatocurvus halotolerans]
MLLYALLGACTPPDDSNTLTVVAHADLQSLDPIVTTVGIVQRHALMVYDVLFARDAQQRPQPQMIETWSMSEDGLVWSFRLREGLLFHDGQPVTARDVVASLRRWGARDPFGRQLLARTIDLAADSDNRFTWRLSEPYGLMLHALSKTGGPIPVIMPERLAQTDPSVPVREVVGSGPFMFSEEEWIPGSKVVYLRNPDYLPRSEPASGAAGGKVVHVDRVEWLNIRDAQSAVFALSGGEIDYLENPAVDFLPMLESAGMIVERKDPLGMQGMMRMNHLHPPFDDPRARRALLFVLDQGEILQAMFGNDSLVRECAAFFTCGSPLASTAGAPEGMGERPERARQLFAEAGYGGEPLVLLHPTDIQYVNIATLVFAQQLERIGVNVDLQAMDFGSMAARRSNRSPPEEGGWHLGMTYWPGGDVSDPVGNLPMHASCGDAWPGWPCDDEHQALIERFPAALMDEERLELSVEIQRSAYELVPYVPMGQWYLPVAYSPRLEGVLEVPGTVVFWNISKSPTAMP